MDRTDSKIDTLLARLRSQAVPPRPRGPRVYFVRKGDEVKIGFTHRLSQRMVQLGGDKLVLLGTVPGTTTTERVYHQRFAHLRLHGEWFQADPELLDAIKEEAEAPAPWEPSYADMARVYMKETKALRPNQPALTYAETSVGFWLNMLANGETPERLAGLQEAVGALERMKAAA